MATEAKVFRCGWCGDHSGPCYFLVPGADDDDVPEHCPMDGDEGTCTWELIDLEDLVI